MIIAMSKLRLMGPRERLPEVLRVLQDLSLLHLASPQVAANEPIAPAVLTGADERQHRHLRSLLADINAALADLQIPAAVPAGPLAPPSIADLARWARLARRTRREAERLRLQLTGLEEEHALILKYQQFFSAFRALLEAETHWPNATAYHVLIRGTDAGAIPKLRASLSAAIGADFEIYTQPLASGEIALLIIVAAPSASRVEQLLAQAQVQEIPVPTQYGGGALAQAIPRMLSRLQEIPAAREQAKQRQQQLAREHGSELHRARRAVHDRLRELEAVPLTCCTPHAFVLEGWAPSRSRGTLESRLRAAFGDAVVVEELSIEDWASEEAPVVLSNPRLFRPFEALVRVFPLPRYGTIDPTPFVAVFFPAFFGIMVGDIGYGAVLAIAGLVLHRLSRPETMLRTVAEIIGPCALFTIIAGFLFGEAFGDLGKRLGLHPIAFDRHEAMIPFLLLAVSLGVVHILLGMGLGIASAIRRNPREAMGRGVATLMVVLVILALLAAIKVLPRSFFTPAVIGLLIAFPLLVVFEGIVAPIELLSTLGNILSYARIMALGVASVMLAVVANKMVGAIGSLAVGIMFALLFHFVNFAIAVFSPTVHALRLHYVEFFGKFYSPGGVRYQPFGHWSPARPPI
ncbi:MAG TPA: V-type ATPase 116kDa subunit family protein [Gemmatimonadales bacterium]|nr:V-type ATPase 116kDa subunit family protein [Gemmatimonadales bacterium]